MQSFEKISKMNLADIDRPGTQDDPDELDTNPDVDAEVDAAESGDTSPEIVTVADVEGTAAAGTAETREGAAEKKQMRQPEGTHYYIDAKITEKEMLAFLFGHNYRQPLMLVAVAIAVIWPIIVVVRNDSNMWLAIALAVIILIALPLSTWNRGRKTVKNNPAYQQTFHYMVDEWGVHLELGDECIDVEWKKVYKCTFMKSVTTVYTGKVNAFLIPTAAMGEQAGEINAFMKKMKNK